MENKNEIFKLISENKCKFIAVPNGKTKDEKYLCFLQSNNIQIPISEITEQNVYDYLTNSLNKFCSCGNENKFYSFGQGYQKYCSKTCLHKWRSQNMLGDKNNVYKIPSEKINEIRIKQSNSMRKAIREGRFTPCVTNSWAKSRCDVKIVRNYNEIIVKCRSSWDAYFQLLNPKCEYEKLRIPYIHNNQLKNYLVDFLDTFHKKIYEIKPSSLEDTLINKLKFESADRWAKENNYEFIIITEDWFKNNYDESLIFSQPDYLKMKKLLKQFK